MKDRTFGVRSDVDALDTERILRALESHGVEYILIGGLAAIAHGSTLATADADVLPSPEPENLDRLLDALESLSAKVLVGEQRLAIESGEPWEVSELRRGVDGLRQAQAWHFSTSAGSVDVVMTATGVGAYDVHLPRAESRVVFGIAIRIAGLDDLIASKAATGRPKDEAILRELRDL